ncbi:cytidine deaminase [Leifsonia sp. NPDC058292]|uniref:cytidine deaminase n=1 Tax=Leifsonia sp. NPDC058292 TaxID=3346428 RepID=UPI0036DE674E
MTLGLDPVGLPLTRLAGEVRAFLDARFPTGDHGAAGVLLDDGCIVTSTSPPASNPAVDYCHELGAFAEAFKRDRRILASVCIAREGDRMVVLSPCGVCLERLRDHGDDVLVGVPAQPGRAHDDLLRWVKLREALPYDWRHAPS